MLIIYTRAPKNHNLNLNSSISLQILKAQFLKAFEIVHY